MIETAVFVVFALLALGSAVVVVSHKNPVYSTIALVFTLVSLAVFFVLLGAPFLAALQILIYTGAILVLFLFVIMLLNVAEEEMAGPAGKRLQRWLAGLAALVFAAMIGLGAYNAFAGAEITALEEEYVSLKTLARGLFTGYLLPFEIVGLLLLVAVIAATILARKPLPAAEEEAEP